MPRVLKIYEDHCNAWGNKQLTKPQNWKPTPKDHLLTFDVAVRDTGSTGCTAASICKSNDGTLKFVTTSCLIRCKLTIGGDSQVAYNQQLFEYSKGNSRAAIFMVLCT